MVKLTLIARVADGLPLAEGLDTEKAPEMDSYKAQAKAIFKKLQTPATGSSKLSIESGGCMFHYITQGGVCYLTLTEKGYPKKLAFQYLEELATEFNSLYGTQAEAVTRPYAFIKFDTFIQKTKKLYNDTRSQRNMAKLNEDLAEVHTIMTKNIQEVLGQGEKLDRMTQMSSVLTAEAKQYAVKAKDLHRQALIRKWAPLVIVTAVVLLLLWLRRVLYH